MDIIELEHWVPDPENPGRVKYAGQPTAQEIFEELKYRLESMGCLPDEYFVMDSEWENGREIPRDADIFCTVDYGESEGVDLDVYLKWLKSDVTVTEPFIIGKTFGESGSDLDRMFLISSAITKAFHGENSLCCTDSKCNGRDGAGGSVLHLSMQEQNTVINALAEQRERQENTLTQTEQLLRRMTGNITAYMDRVGQRPLNMTDSDRVVLAIRDGNLKEAKELLPRITGQDTLNMLFLEAAGRPGAAGRKMTLLLLEDGVYSEDTYRQACEKAVNIVDAEKVALFQEQAKEHTDMLSLEFFGELARYALQWHGVWFIAEQIMERCSTEEIFAAPKSVLEIPLVCGEMAIPKVLAQAGVNGDHVLRPFIKCRGQGEPGKLRELLDLGMKVSPDNYDALAACVEYDCPEIGKALIDHGVDFEGFASWAEEQEKDISCDSYQELVGYWQERRQESGQEQAM